MSKFQKLIHPEILLGTRGSKEFHQFYKQTVYTIEFAKQGDEGGMRTSEIVTMLNTSEQRAMALMQRWRLDNGKIFHVNKDFLQALSKVERKVELKYLPERFVGYISFADGTIFDESDEVEGAYVYVGPATATMLKNPGTDRVFWCAYICKGFNAMGTVYANINQGDYVEDLIARVESDNARKNQLYLCPDEGTLSKRSAVFNTVLNCVMYIHSAEPDVRRVPSIYSLTHSKRAKIEKETGIKNGCSLPITFLNWNYAKQRSYSVDSTWVESHPRWQPCGPNLSQIKLVWVKEHERHFKNAPE